MSFRKIFFTILVAVLSGCSEGMDMPVKGDVIFGGQGISSLSVEDGAVRSIETIDTISVESISVISSENFLISFFDLAPSENRNRIAIYHSSTRDLQDILFGKSAVYFSADHKIVYYDSMGYLSIVDADNLTMPRAISDRPRSVVVPIVKVSDSEFLYESEGINGREIFKYETGSSSKTEIKKLEKCSFSRALWVERNNQVLCIERGAGGVLLNNYVLIDLEGNVEKRLDFQAIAGWPVAYLADEDSLLVQGEVVVNGKVEYPIFLYSLSDMRLNQIAKNTLMSRGVGILR